MAAIVLFLIAILTAPQTQARDAGAAPAGTGVIEGRVVFADDPTQVARRVVVTLTAAELPMSRSAVTDDEGRFAFANVPPGRFTIAGRRPAFLTAAYGARRPGGPGTPLALAAGQHVTGITLSIALGAAIGGTIRDSAGDPAGGVYVFAVKTAALGSQGATPPSAAVVTDDRGGYRLFGLEPGEYVVMAAVRPTGSGEIDAATTSRVDALLAALERGPVRADAPLRPIAQPSSASGEAVVPPRTTYTFASVYYPGTALASDAARIALAPGDDHGGMDFTLSLTPVASIDGTIAGARENTDLQISIAGDGPKMQSWVVSSPTLVKAPGADGRFKYSGVAPGHYVVMVRTTMRAPAPSGNGVPAFLSTDDRTQWAQVDLNVNGADISGLSLDLQPAFKFSGRVQLDAAAPPASFDFTKVRVSLTSKTGGMSVTNGQIGGHLTVPPVSARADGTFDVSGVMPGEYTVTCSAGGAEWSLISAVGDGRDLLDAPLRFTQGSGSPSGVVLTLSNRHSELSGELQLAAGASAADYAVIVFPVARELWVPASRRIAIARPATDGQFAFRDLPAGEYALAALTDVTGDDSETIALLDQALPGSVRVTLQTGEHRTQNIRVVR